MTSSKKYLAAMALMLLTACTTMPASHTTSTAEATLAYILAGQGSPVVVLESGLGDGMESWSPVYERLSSVSTVFAYDRAGYGASRSRNRSRDGATIVRELRTTLGALGVEPPYVLVGHSIGGTYMELFARTYPDDVAGVVFVDSRHADFTRRCQLAGVHGCTPPAALSALMPQGPRREMQQGEKTMAEVLAASSFPDVPVAVLTSGKQALTSGAFREVWLETQLDLAGLSPNSTHVVCSHCGHYIHRDAPDMVIDAIEDVLKAVRQ